MEEALWVVDAGSTNGIWLQEEDVRIAQLQGGDRLMLGEEVLLAFRVRH